jgi:hypothetical protein
MKRLGYIMASLTIFTNVFAQSPPKPASTCSGFDKFLGVGVTNDNVSQPLRCEQLRPLEQVFTDIAQLSSSELPPPILFAKNSLLPQIEIYNMDTGVIEVGVNPASELEMRALPKLFAHELGHHIFYANAFKNLPVYSDIADISSLYYQVMAEERTDLRGIFYSESFTSFIDLFGLVMENSSEDLAKFEIVSESYQELFADVVAAVYFEDPEVMKQSMVDFHKVDTDRSFSVDLPITAASSTIVHNYFISVRGSLWKEWIKPRLGEHPNFDTKKKVIEDLLQIFVSEIKRRVSDGEPLLKETTVEEDIALNKNAVDGLKKALRIK